MKNLTGLNHLEGKGVDMWGLWAQCEWELMPEKGGGEANENELCIGKEYVNNGGYCMEGNYNNYSNYGREFE